MGSTIPQQAPSAARPFEVVGAISSSALYNNFAWAGPRIQNADDTVAICVPVQDIAFPQ
jgi:hypothetical protein